MIETMEKLAIHGGHKAKTTPSIPMYPGGLEIGEEERRQVLEVLDSRYLFRYYGPTESPSKVQELEQRFAARFGVDHALATSSCTGALVSALAALGVGPGDEVIVPGYTFFASAASIVNIGAVPVIADTDDTLTIDVNDVANRITPLTKGILTVHMRGAPCDMDGLQRLCRERNLFLIEDTAQAIGGSYKGRPLGTIGDIGCYSFQYHKVITGGEGGMLVTNDERLFARAQGYHDTAACWRPERFAPQRFEGELFCGDNYRMGELNGAVLLAQFDRLDGLSARMKHHRARLTEGIRDLPGITVRPSHDDSGDASVCVFFYLDSAKKLAPFMRALAAEGVGVSGDMTYDSSVPDWHIYAHWTHLLEKKSHASVTPWNNPAYTERGGNVEYRADMCPHMLEYLSRAVHLDIPAQMTDEDVDMTVKAITKVAHAQAAGEL